MSPPDRLESSRRQWLKTTGGLTLAAAGSQLGCAATGDGRAQVILLGMVLATTEARTAKDAWRGPQDITKTYLRFLEDNGYTLSDIEQVILGKRKADAVYRQACKED